MSASGNYDDAIAAILDMYGGQIKYGGTMFFEVYRPQWNDGLETNGPVPNNQAGYTSLAHPWGAGVLSWISEELLGIKPKKAGFEMFSVTPHLGRQLTRVSGKMPTPHGIINASFDVLKGAASLTVLDGTLADIGIPKAEKVIKSIKMNGNIADIVSQDNDFVYINGLTAGEYTFEISYSGNTPKFKDIEYDYAADFIGVVKKSDKSFGEIYGADGCFLCAYDPNDRISLPKYVSDVRFRLAKSVNWSVDTDDERALQYDDVSKTKRKIGAYHTDGRQPCAQSFTVDIVIAKPGAEYTVALYFVDWDRQGRQMAVDMFDGNTYDMIAPTQVIKNCENGVYLVYKYTDSVRFRINQMRGEDAVLSGIFFGECR